MTKNFGAIGSCKISALSSVEIGECSTQIQDKWAKSTYTASKPATLVERLACALQENPGKKHQVRILSEALTQARSPVFESHRNQKPFEVKDHFNRR